MTIEETNYESGPESTFSVGEPSLVSPRAELEELLEANEGRLGDVYRLSQEGLTAEQIADRLNVATIGFVYSNRYQVQAILDGKLTPSLVMRGQATSAINGLIKRGRSTLSPDALLLLQTNRAALAYDSSESDPVAQAAEEIEEEREATNTLASLEGIPGIYAFSYGWYLESPVDAEHGNTLIKVGKADDVATRIRQHTQGARTHMPEPLALIRVYATNARDPLAIEKSFHEIISSAGHSNPRRIGKASREVGREWFLTNENLLDAVAKALDLRTLYIGRSEFGAD